MPARSTGPNHNEDGKIHDEPELARLPMIALRLSGLSPPRSTSLNGSQEPRKIGLRMLVLDEARIESDPDRYDQYPAWEKLQEGWASQPVRRLQRIKTLGFVSHEAFQFGLFHRKHNGAAPKTRCMESRIGDDHIIATGIGWLDVGQSECGLMGVQDQVCPRLRSLPPSISNG